MELPDILCVIHNGNTHDWSILAIEAIGNLGEGQSYLEFEKEVSESENGLYITWEDLNALSKKFDQIIWITIIGCKDEKQVRFYKNKQEMYETCDIVIEMFDSYYWIIYSKDEYLIDRLASKFKEVEFLESDLKK